MNALLLQNKHSIQLVGVRVSTVDRGCDQQQLRYMVFLLFQPLFFTWKQQLTKAFFSVVLSLLIISKKILFTYL